MNAIRNLKPAKGILLCRRLACENARLASSKGEDGGPRKATTPLGRLDDAWESKREKMQPQQTPDSPEAEKVDPYARFPNDKNPLTGEIGGPRGPEPTRYGDWERKGRVIDF